MYDGDGNLVKKIKPDGSKTIYVGGVYEVDKAAGGSVERTVTYYPAAGAMRIDSTLYYVLKDHLGSASVVTNASGTTVGEQRYYPFGETRLTTGSIFTDKLFTGQREITGLGIYHFNARFYSPKLGRFLSPDTIVPGYSNPQHLNRFGYVTNNPLRYTDPTGHMLDDGCRTVGCNLTQTQKVQDAKKLASLENETSKRKCASGNKNYCSGYSHMKDDIKTDVSLFLHDAKQAYDAGVISFALPVGGMCPACQLVTEKVEIAVDVTGRVVGGLINMVNNSKGPSVNTNPHTPTPSWPVPTWTPDPTATGVTPTNTTTPRPSTTPIPSPTSSLTLTPLPTWTPTTTPTFPYITPTFDR